MSCSGSGSSIASWTSIPSASSPSAEAAGCSLDGLLRLTYFWRRRVDTFEVLGLDQARRLTDIGIAGGTHPAQAQPFAGDIRSRACPTAAAG